jgi:hypothetical protein
LSIDTIVEKTELSEQDVPSLRGGLLLVKASLVDTGPFFLAEFWKF